MRAMNKLALVFLVAACGAASKSSPPASRDTAAVSSQNAAAPLPPTEAATSSPNPAATNGEIGATSSDRTASDETTPDDDVPTAKHSGLLGSTALTDGAAFGSSSPPFTEAAPPTDSSGGSKKSSRPPAVMIGQATSQGSLDKAIIRRHIRRNIQKLTYCYVKQLQVKPNLQGTVTAKFVIGADGHVTSSTAMGVDSTVASCIATVIGKISFPEPEGGGKVDVSYPFELRP